MSTWARSWALAGLMMFGGAYGCGDRADAPEDGETIDDDGEPASADAISSDSGPRKSARDAGGDARTRAPDASRPRGPAADEADAAAPSEADGGTLAESDAGGEAPSSTHGRLAEPNYEVVFPKTKVNELTITVSPAMWQAMLDDMTRLWGARGSTGRPPAGGQPGGGGALGGFPTENPMYGTASISFNGLTWEHVGVRFKGNSSLRAAWSSNNDRFPLRIDFDEHEETHPEIKNQRFYGVKTLSLSNNTGDPTHMREALYYDISGQAELVTPAYGFYEIFLDRGEGRKSLGLYTVLEIVRETVIPRYFEDPSGRLFKAESTASNLAVNSRANLSSGFENEGGPGREEEIADWSELEALHDALHATTRTSNAAAWRMGLEALFDVPSYLRWLALSTLFQHWDTYGRMPHNYYLYNDPATQKLHWISWDHNFVLSAGGGMGGFPGGGGVAFDKSRAGNNWPLITFLYMDPSYRAAYDGALTALVETEFDPGAVNAIIDRYASLLQPYAAKSSSTEGYAQAVLALKNAVANQAAAARTYLAQ